MGIGHTTFADNRSDFDKWLKQETSSYQEYRDKRDKEFTGFLKKQWKELETFQGLKRDPTPKPVKMPVAPPPPPEPRPTPQVKIPEPQPGTPTPVPEVKKPQPVITPPPVVKVPPIAPPPKPVVIKPVPVLVAKGSPLSMHFYGQKLKFNYDPKLKVRLNSRINGNSISNHWSALSKADYEDLVKQINMQKKPLELNDWGYASLVHMVSQQVNPGHPTDQALFDWFVLTKAGYRARIAYDDNNVYLLMPTMQKLYGAPYFTFDNVRYYAVSFSGGKKRLGRVFTYDGDYPGANKPLNMMLAHAINTLPEDKVKTLKFKYQGKTYHIKAEYDKETIDFLNTYPQMDIKLYFDSKVNPATGSYLLRQLKPLVEGKTEEDAVNLLLRFVQTAFKYKTDEAQFGAENYLFPEETLYYPYSDCEDRAVLFAWLVRNLVGLEVVGLDFPGHIATAVHFNENVKGDALMYEGKRYVISDPTYINANAGMTMPNYKNTRPGVIAF